MDGREILSEFGTWRARIPVRIALDLYVTPLSTWQERAASGDTLFCRLPPSD